VLFALVLPATLPTHYVLLGAFFVVMIGREFLGGIGQNRFHPVLVGYVILVTIFPYLFGSNIAQPLRWMPYSGSEALWQLLMGRPQVILGASSLIVMVISACILFTNRWARWDTSFWFLLAVLALSFVTDRSLDAVLYSGTVWFFALFILSDFGTGPITSKGRVVFGVGAGLLSILFESKTGYFPIAIACAVLLMDGFVPTLDHFLRPRK
jgi:Na+-translocating ferredoxin:NAD+ oxidoreductase subunit D